MMDEIRYKRCRILRDLLASPMMNEAMATTHVDIINALLRTEPIDHEAREALYYESKAFTRLTGNLQSIANEATMYEDEVKKSKEKGFKLFGDGAN